MLIQSNPTRIIQPIHSWYLKNNKVLLCFKVEFSSWKCPQIALISVSTATYAKWTFLPSYLTRLKKVLAFILLFALYPCIFVLEETGTEVLCCFEMGGEEDEDLSWLWVCRQNTWETTIFGAWHSALESIVSGRLKKGLINLGALFSRIQFRPSSLPTHSLGAVLVTLSIPLTAYWTSPLP